MENEKNTGMTARDLRKLLKLGYCVVASEPVEGAAASTGDKEAPAAGPNDGGHAEGPPGGGGHEGTGTPSRDPAGHKGDQEERGPCTGEETPP